MLRASYSLCVAFFLSLASVVSADGLSASQYSVYEQNVNGTHTLYLVPEESVLLLHGDIATPIIYMPDGPAFQATRNADGSLNAFDKMPAGSNSRTLLAICGSPCVKSNYVLHGADFNADGYQDVLLQGRGANHSVVVTLTASTASVYATLGTAIDANSHIASISNINGGLPDIQVSRYGQQHIYSQQSAGVFAKIRYVPEFNVAGLLGSTPASTLPVNESNATLVGSISGKHSVGQNGSAKYRVDIFTALGTAGVSPKLSLKYSSHSSNSIAGLGWSLGGISSISRCPQSLRQDGNIGVVNYTSTDRFCLDGQRLVATSGVYGGDGTTYRTEIDSYAVVSSHGIVNGQPEYFKVVRNDGSTSYYGNGNSSQQLAGEGTIVSWSINLFKDSAGNPIRFSYLNEGGHRIHRIDYAYGGSSSDADSATYVQFRYGLRPDSTKKYIAGDQIEVNQRLVGIDSYSADSLDPVRSYYLGYGAHVGGSPSRLNRLYECSGSECYKPLVFEWEDSQLGFSGGVSTQLNSLATELAVTGQPADINGDGLMDLVWVKADVTTEAVVNKTVVKDICWKDAYTLPLDRVNVTGSFDALDGTIKGGRVVCFPKINPNTKAFEQNITTDKFAADKNVTHAGWGPGEENGEALDEIQAACLTDVYIVYEDNMSRSSPVMAPWVCESSIDQVTNFETANLELAYALSDGTSLVEQGVLGQLNTSDPGLWRALDINLDGYTDVLRADASLNGRWYLDIGGPSGITSGTTEVLSAPPNSSLVLADINGDGLMDAVFKSNDSQFVYYPLQQAASGGTYSYSFSSTGHTIIIAGSGFSHFDTPKLVDFNGDGVADVIGRIGNQLAIYLNDGEGNYNHYATVAPSTALALDQFSVVDVNSDGLKDLVWTEEQVPRVTLTLNTGAGFVVAATHSVRVNSISDISWQDFDKDGALDFVLSTGFTYDVWLYQRNEERFRFSHSLPMLRNLSDADSQFFMDINGDGHEDSVHFVTENSGKNLNGNADISISLSSNTARVPNVIKAVDNGIGKHISFTYKPLTDNTVYTRESDATNTEWALPEGSTALAKNQTVLDLKYAKYVVASVSSSSPSAGVSPGLLNSAALAWTDFHYQGAKYQVGHGYLGFHKRKVSNRQTGLVSEEVYRQDFPFTGALLSSENRVANQLLSRKNNNWVYLPVLGSGDASYYQRYVDTATSESYEPNSSYESNYTVQNFVIDSWGNTTQQITSVFEGGERFSYQSQVQVDTDFGSDSDHVRFGRVGQKTVVYRGANADDIERNYSYSYYPSATDENGDMSGNSLRLQLEAVEPLNPALNSTTSYEYDGFGNVTKTILAAAGLANRYTRWEYDGLGRYIDRSFNSLDTAWGEGSPLPVETVDSRNSLGLVTQKTGVNGLVTNFSYDAMGRPLTQSTNTGTSQIFTLAITSSVAGAQYKLTTAGNDGSSSTEYYDALGRSIAASQRGFDGSDYWVFKEYDDAGRVKHISEPALFNQQSYWTINEYDAFGRMVRVTLPDLSHQIFSYDGALITVTNPLSQTKRTSRNGLGLVTQVVDFAGTTIDYSYSADKQLSRTAVSNSAGTNTITTLIEYDGLGRKSKMIDPDKGTRFYESNAFGELITQYKVSSTHYYSGSQQDRPPVLGLVTQNNNAC